MGTVRTAIQVSGEIAGRSADVVAGGIKLPFRVARFLTAAVLNEMCKPPHIPELIAGQYVTSAHSARKLIALAASQGLDEAVQEVEDLLARTLVEAHMHPLVSENDLDAVAGEVNPRHFRPEANPHVPQHIAVVAQKIVQQSALIAD